METTVAASLAQKVVPNTVPWDSTPRPVASIPGADTYLATYKQWMDRNLSYMHILKLLEPTPIYKLRLSGL